MPSGTRRNRQRRRGRKMITSHNVILTAAFLGYHLTDREALEILAFWIPWESLEDKIRDYCAAYES